MSNRIGLLADLFFATVFLGSGILFVAMLFAAVAASRGLLVTFTTGSCRELMGDQGSIRKRVRGHWRCGLWCCTSLYVIRSLPRKCTKSARFRDWKERTSLSRLLRSVAANHKPCVGPTLGLPVKAQATPVA